MTGDILSHWESYGCLFEFLNDCLKPLFIKDLGYFYVFAQAIPYTQIDFYSIFTSGKAELAKLHI